MTGYWSVIIVVFVISITAGTGCDEKCFNEYNLGCFCLKPPPASPESIDPQFYFYQSGSTKLVDFNLKFIDKNLENQLKELSIDLTSSEFFVLIHGFGGEWSEESWMTNIKDVLVKKGHHVMIVRWTGGSEFPFYYKAGSNTRIVGAMVAKVIKALTKTKQLSVDKVTVIGHSLGAHVAGFTGKSLPGIHRIIGSDPAGPLFDDRKPTDRLAKTDAKFVVVLHCDADTYGISEPIGTVDYYPDGGSDIASCIDEPFGCDHMTCPQLLQHILNDKCSMKTYQCASMTKWLEGGCFNEKCPTKPEACKLLDVASWNANSGLKGNYYFNTKEIIAHGTATCGQQYLMTITAEDLVIGSLKVKVQDDQGQWSHSALFQGPLEKVDPGEKSSQVIVYPHRLKCLVKADIFFESARVDFGLDLLHKPTISKLTIEKEDGMKYQSEGVVSLTEGKHVEVKLIRI